MSARQQRQLIEAAFLPHVCKCKASSEGLLTIHVCDAVNDVLLLEVSDVCADALVSWEAIDKFAIDLQRNLRCGITVTEVPVEAVR
ncbi:DUF1652 domain-containing protein [Pseudomonas argentinensis]|uniref:DUF1652 domain-containing protein n=1 Tax=Phytopseudomonas argentinensis TaxID=289370 RepID=UPI003AF36FF2